MGLTDEQGEGLTTKHQDQPDRKEMASTNRAMKIGVGFRIGLTAIRA